MMFTMTSMYRNGSYSRCLLVSIESEKLGFLSDISDDLNKPILRINLFLIYKRTYFIDVLYGPKYASDVVPWI